MASIKLFSYYLKKQIINLFLTSGYYQKANKQMKIFIIDEPKTKRPKNKMNLHTYIYYKDQTEIKYSVHEQYFKSNNQKL